jgi:hypothetical protein
MQRIYYNIENNFTWQNNFINFYQHKFYNYSFKNYENYFNN